MKNKIVILVCEHYVREAKRALLAEGFEDAAIVSFPARCGRPPLTEDELEAILQPHSDAQSIEILGAACIAALQDRQDGLTSWRRHHLRQCFHLVADDHMIDKFLSSGAYLTTPGWLSHWRENLKKMGLDRKTARVMFGETTSRIVLLDTGLDKKSTENVRAFSENVDRPWETFYTGISFIRLLITRFVMEHRLKMEKALSAQTIREVHKQSANYAMVVDLLGNLARITDENRTIEELINLYRMLFAPGKIACLTLRENLPDKLWLDPPEKESSETETLRNFLAGFNKKAAIPPPEMDSF